LIFARRGTARRLPQSETIEHFCEKLAIFRQFDAFRLRANDRDPRSFQSGGEIERCLTAELDDRAFRFFLLVNIEYVFVGEGFEIKLVARVVIGRNRFGVGINHDGLDSEFTESERGMDTAIVEFDSLADTVRPTAQNHDFAARAWPDF